MSDALRKAFGVLIRAAPSATAAAAYRAALSVLITPPLQLTENRNRPDLVEQPHSPPGNGAPATDAAANWEVLRPRLHAIVAAADTTGRYEISHALGISSTTLRGIISTSTPGAATIGRVATWLASRDRDEIAEEAPHPGNGADGATLHRLSREQRERLAGYASLDPMQIRRQIGVTAELVSRAVAGQSLDPAIVERLAAFLECGGGDGCGDNLAS
jgi:hypothetical protein